MINDKLNELKLVFQSYVFDDVRAEILTMTFEILTVTDENHR